MIQQETIYPGIRAVWWVDCDKLPQRVDLHGICRARVSLKHPMEPIDTTEEPKCLVVTVRTDKKREQTVHLRFSSTALLPIHRHLGFVLRDNAGLLRLIGRREGPWPEVKVQTGVGDCDTDGAAFEYDVTHTAPATMVECDAAIDTATHKCVK